MKSLGATATTTAPGVAAGRSRRGDRAELSATMFIRTRSVVLLTGETCVLLTAVVAGTFVQLGSGAVKALSDGGLLRVALVVGVCQLCLHYADLYDLPRLPNLREVVVRLLMGVGATALIFAVLYSW